MGERNLYTPFELFEADMSEWNPRPRVYYFFEIIQIQEGSGVRIVNQNRFSYKKGSIFLFTPQDCRGFEEETPTRFVSIRFSELFVSQCYTQQEKERIGEWLRQLEYLFFNHNKHEPLLIKHVNDCRMIASLIHNMMEEYVSKPPYYQNNLQHYVTLLLNIVARNIAEDVTLNTEAGTGPLIGQITMHIRKYIYTPELLKLEVLATKFNLSLNYIGEYFKKQTGESIQQFIISYKLNLVQLRVSFSDLTIGEIADELGFTDESHMSRLFKKYYGVTPAMYRKERLEEKKLAWPQK
ncbi:AraC-like DNA-binding protein [Chitinophaga niastensis]|uniref:AraC-like DNA-binding protein n=1 Tax=Chitinophaga niastensis TaxID=536980 RepID=A0A2P8HPU8_CHINA|nr:AraC family transcriptional regulator [Chitinophaga niastensis]PSL48248.1 AraC-like DNA-binding protein [Chitinophaga niastensis]